MRTPIFILVAGLVWPENNIKFDIYRKKTRCNQYHLYISDGCTPTIDYLKLKLNRTQVWNLFEAIKKNVIKIGVGEVGTPGPLDVEWPTTEIRSYSIEMLE